jgi:protein gp37
MSDNTSIQWADATWNPIIGCTKISDGCQNCYAEKMARRLSGMERDNGYKNVMAAGHWNNSTFYRHDQLALPLEWKNPRRVFVCSMGDLFHKRVEDWQIRNVMFAISHCPQHTFIILTKRPWRMQEFFKSFEMHDAPAWPWPNVILMTTVENQAMAAKRMPFLCATPAAVRGVSIEPLLTPVDLMPWMNGVSWVVCGCESGIGRRHCDVSWMRHVKNQCIETGTSFFLKQMDVGGELVKMPELDGQKWDMWPVIESKKCESITN